MVQPLAVCTALCFTKLLHQFLGASGCWARKLATTCKQNYPK